jgi:catechol 2,3-dioxygenase
MGGHGLRARMLDLAAKALFDPTPSQYKERDRKAAIMDAQNPSSTVTFANKTPLRIGTVGLKARDLARLTDFYTQAIGLQVIDRDSKTARLGAGGVTLLELEAAPSALPDDPRTAGLYHTAFLQPTRGDLGRWLVHAARNRVSLSGASDHLVSEAIYLDDPEGNGIEVYRDRLPSEWRWNGDRIQMATERLDLDNLAADAGNTSYQGAPDGLRIGHIHLRVGDLAKTQSFYCDAVGLDPTSGRNGALFMSSGRYHHHVGSNIWHSAGAGQRDDERAGLSWFAIEAANEAERAAALERLKRANASLAGAETRDPFGTRVRFTS